MLVAQRSFVALLVAIYGVVVKKIELLQFVSFVTLTLLAAMALAAENLKLLYSLLIPLKRLGALLQLDRSNVMWFLQGASPYYSSIQN
jgi:hypothetical protein